MPVTETVSRTKLLLLALAVLWSSGCLSSQTMITVNASEKGLAALRPEESSHLVDAIETQLRQVTSEPINRLDQKLVDEKSSAMSDYRVLAGICVGGSLPISRIYVLEERSDHTIAVFIDDQGGWPLGASFTKSVVGAVERALAQVFPGHDVRIEQSVGPDFR